MPFNGKIILHSELGQQEQELLNQGLSYKAIAGLTGVKIGTLKERNRLIYHVDIFEAFRNRIQREGIPNRLEVGDDFGYYFSGFFDGEGTLVAFYRLRANRAKSYPEFRLALQIVLRDDDTQILEYIANNIGGRIHHQKARENSNTNPSTRWCLECIKDLAEVIIPLFDKYPLRSKKRREYEIWREMVVQRYILSIAGETTRSGLDNTKIRQDFLAAADAIKAIRQYPNGV